MRKIKEFWFFFILFFNGIICQDLYPKSWVKYGECLDSNQGPLVMAYKPLINPNVIGNATYNVSSLDDCMYLCLNNTKCRFFTYYPELYEPMNETDCLLVGFNLRQACFNLNNVCVLLKECLIFNDTCPTCMTGVRPLIDPLYEPLAVILNGVTDNRMYRQVQKRQYTLTSANLNELAINLDVNKTCLFRNSQLPPRMGSTAAFANNKVIVCGGYTYDDSTFDDTSMSLGNYLSDCKIFSSKNSPWGNFSTMNKTRGFASAISVPSIVSNKDLLFVLGGYNRIDGFLDSVESWNGTWSIEPNLTFSDPMSHFCTVFARNQYGTRYIYKIGGWNIEYSSKFERLQFSNASDGYVVNNGDYWQKLVDLPNPRADHACALIQFDWTLGIIVAGGYDDGAWMKSVDFFDFQKGAWTNVIPDLNSARHYHGITTFGLLPVVFGGWNNGSLSSIEILNGTGLDAEWTEIPNFLQIPREKFAFTRVPENFTFNCN